MTGRRAIQTYAERESRAFQFIPGHVGGRVASAQPVREKNDIGLMGAEVPVVAPEAFDWSYAASYSSPGRFATSVQPLDELGSGSEGDMVAVVMLTEAVAVTPPSPWRVLYSHSWLSFTYHIAVIDSMPASEPSAWSLDWTGVTGLGEWALQIFRFEKGSDPISGMTWDYKVSNNDGEYSGTWVQPDPSWSYSISTFAIENGEYNSSDYDDNSYGIAPYWYSILDTSMSMLTYGRVSPSTGEYDADTYAVGYTLPSPDDAGPWIPDQYYESWGYHDYPGFYPPNPSNATICLGIK